MIGHLFVVHGDLLLLSSDAVVLPCDDTVSVSQYWKSLLPPEKTSSGSWSDWLSVDARLTDGRTRVQIEPLRVDLVDTVSPLPDVERLVKVVGDAVRVAAEDLEAGHKRAIPLVALPLVGTGNGGLRNRRGAVVAKLVPELSRVAEESGVDVALVVEDARDYAAAQAHRASDAWASGEGELTASHLAQADTLGDRAATGELSLFLGAGVSMPVGLPGWLELLNLLSSAAGEPKVHPHEDLPAAAARIKAALGHRYVKLLTETLNVPKHAIGHGLLANLGVTRMVTTNFDPCLELAMRAILGVDGLRVLTRHLASGQQPWLLKLHGDIAKPSSLVLTTDDYEAMCGRDQALGGTVQGLMLTGHLLFVGYSLADVDFIELATQVRRVRLQADATTQQSRAGTVLALHAGDLQTEAGAVDLTVIPMLETQAQEGSKTAGRTMEMFLDRMAWTASRNRPQAAQYLLDARYDEGFTQPSDIALRRELLDLMEGLSADARASSAWPVVEHALVALGGEDRVRQLRR